jgi:hypothetical protein
MSSSKPVTVEVRNSCQARQNDSINSCRLSRDFVELRQDLTPASWFLLYLTSVEGSIMIHLGRMKVGEVGPESFMTDVRAVHEDKYGASMHVLFSLSSMNCIKWPRTGARRGGVHWLAASLVFNILETHSSGGKWSAVSINWQASQNLNRPIYPGDGCSSWRPTKRGLPSHLFPSFIETSWAKAGRAGLPWGLNVYKYGLSSVMFSPPTAIPKNIIHLHPSSYPQNQNPVELCSPSF